MKNLLSNANSKLMKDGIFHWSIPAFVSKTGFLTCPGARDCIKGCYARQGFHGMSWVQNAKEQRLAAALTPGFIDRMSEEITRRKVRVLRIHDAGDFYSESYLVDWLTIADLQPRVQFYAYTKMIPLFKTGRGSLTPPPNFKAIFSFGGKWDDLIDVERDHHAVVFKSHDDLARSDYADATESDLVAVNSRKVGLVYHGGRHLNWGV